jgi:large subunit ribosomal protein L4
MSYLSHDIPKLGFGLMRLPMLEKEVDIEQTKTMVDMFKALSAERKPLVVLPEVNAYVVKSCANIPGAKTCLYNTINVYDILNADTFITTVAAVKMLEEVYA